MNRLINTMAKLAIFKSDFDYHLMRASMVFIAFFFGYQKWFQYEANALIPYISHGPLIFWLYPVFGIRGATYFLGVSESSFGVLLFLGFWNKKLGILGALGFCFSMISTEGCMPYPKEKEYTRNRKELEQMKKINIQMFATTTAIAAIFVLSVPAQAQNASEAVYKSKCAACHGPDGSGSAMGKKLGVHDFQTVDVPKMSDAELAGIIADGKNKMPAYGKSLKAEDIKGLVAYIRSLAPAK